MTTAREVLAEALHATGTLCIPSTWTGGYAVPTVETFRCTPGVHDPHADAILAASPRLAAMLETGAALDELVAAAGKHTWPWRVYQDRDLRTLTYRPVVAEVHGDDFVGVADTIAVAARAAVRALEEKG